MYQTKQQLRPLVSWDAMLCGWANGLYVSDKCGACLGPLDPSR